MTASPSADAGRRFVLVDTSAWIDHDHDRGLAGEVERLIRARQVLTTPPVVAELLRGARGAAGRRKYRALLDLCPTVEPGREDWLRAGAWASEFDEAGARIPLFDLLLAALAVRLGAAILTSDPHFETIAEKKPLQLL